MEKIEMRTVLVAAALALSVLAYGQRVEKVPLGDFEQWTVREIKESPILGGKTREIYMIAAGDTIRRNEPFDYSNTIWATSNAYAVVMGITQTSVSVMPDKGPDGTCAKLATSLASLKVAGMMNVDVVASGSVFWGRALEPISSVSKPYSFFDWGSPFTGRPDAVIIDFKSVVPNTGKLRKGSKEMDGYDPESIVLILQNRVEDSKGNIHVKRVGTAALHISEGSGGWMRNVRIPVIYGDPHGKPGYREYMRLNTSYYAVNSRGKSVPIAEEGWADPSTPVTHAILAITSGSRDDMAGALGNILWVDNVRLEYE